MKENSSDGTVHILLTIIAALIFSISLSVGPEVSNVYYLYCSDYEAKGPSCPAERQALQQSYRVIPEKGLVVSDGLIDYKNCIIHDKENWLCSSNGHTFKMSKGDYLHFADLAYYNSYEEYDKANRELLESNTRNPQVSWFYWYIFRWYTFFRDL